MLNQESIEKIKELTKEFFQKATLDVEIEVLPEKENTVPVNIKSVDPQILIGEGGRTLIEIQHILKIFLRKKINEQFHIDLDVNDYKKNKAEHLREIARTAADEVTLLGKEKTLSPMSAYERRIIHLELLNRSDVSSESAGEGEERRVVIKPRANNPILPPLTF